MKHKYRAIHSIDCSCIAPGGPNYNRGPDMNKPAPAPTFDMEVEVEVDGLGRGRISHVAVMGEVEE